MRTSARLGAAAISVVAALALLPFGGSSAFAHAGYESSTPADGEVLAESPPRVDMYTNQEMARLEGLPTLVVVNDAGDILSEEAVLDDADRTHVSAELPADMAPGRYTVIWHTLSDEDGEEAQGAFHFYVGEGSGETPTPAESGEPATPQATGTPAPPDSGGDEDDGGVPVWALIAGVVAGVVVGGGAALAFGRRGG